MAFVWDSTTLTRLYQDGEIAFATTNKCIVDRIALSIVAGTDLYEVPDYTLDIRRVTWKGKPVDPMPGKLQQKIFDGRILTQTAERPDYYIFNNVQRGRIKFFPKPNVTIGAVTNDLYGAEIKNRVIVEFFRVPDSATYKIPMWFRRRLLKTYVLSRAFLMEGKGVNLKAAEYYESKFNDLSLTYAAEMRAHFERGRTLMLSDPASESYNVASPRLNPDKYWIGVDY